MASSPILDLNSLIERPTIAIDGERYEILAPEELSVADYQRFIVAGRQLQDAGSADADDNASAEALGLLREIGDRIMVGVPEEVRQKLSIVNLYRVVEGFMTLLRAQRPPLAQESGAAAPEAQASPSTGAKPPQDSSASTAAIPNAGSPASPSPSSGPISS